MVNKFTDHPFFWATALIVTIILLLLLAYPKEELLAGHTDIVVISTCLIAVPLSVFALLIVIDYVSTKLKNRNRKK